VKQTFAQTTSTPAVRCRRAEIQKSPEERPTHFSQWSWEREWIVVEKLLMVTWGIEGRNDHEHPV